MGAQLQRRLPVLAIVALIALSAALALVVDVAQRAIQRDGSVPSPSPAPPDVVALDLAVYGVASVGLIVTYVALVVLCRRDLVRGRWAAAVLATPIAVGVALLPHRPALSTDVLSYVAQGSLSMALEGGTVYSHPELLALTPLGDELLRLGWVIPWNPSPYGPLWGVIEMLVVRLPLDVVGQVLTFKALQLAAMVGSGIVIWHILTYVRPGDRLVGTVLFLSNPVVVTELAGEGHIDGFMVLFVLVGVLATLHAAALPSIVSSALGVLTKYLPVILIPPQFAYLWRTAHDRRRLVREAVLGVVIAGSLAAMFLAAIGSTSFLDGLRHQGSAEAWPTLPGGLIALLLRFDVDARAATTIVLAIGLISIVVWASWRVRDADDLLWSMALIAAAYVVLLSTRFYAWYVVLPIALLALVPTRSTVALVVVLTLAARLTAPFVDLRRDAYPFVEAWIVVTFTGVLLSALAVVLVFTPAGTLAIRLVDARRSPGLLRRRGAAPR